MLSKKAREYYDQIIKEALNGEFRSGDFNGKSTGSANGFRTGEFSKTKESYKRDINNKAKSNTRTIYTTGPTSQPKKEPKSDNKTLSISEQTNNGMRAITNSYWFNRLPNSLQQDLKPHIENDIRKALVSGLTEDQMKILVTHKTNRRVSSETLEKYKKLDSMINDVYNSKDYHDKYDNLTARKTGLKVGTGIGAVAGLGLGMIQPSARLKASLVGGAIGAGLGAGLGRITGVSMDQNDAFNHASTKVAPNMDNAKREARYSLMY